MNNWVTKRSIPIIIIIVVVVVVIIIIVIITTIVVVVVVVIIGIKRHVTVLHTSSSPTK